MSATNKTQHTPGPWYSSPKSDSTQGLIYEENTGKNVAVSYDPKDAHLIAAAPELLAACKRLVAITRNPDVQQLKMAMAAIDKAEGRAQ